MNDYIPDSHSNRLAWLINFKTILLANTLLLKLDAAQLATINTLLDPLIAHYQTLVDAEAAASKAAADADQLFATSLTSLRDLVNNIKNNPASTDGLETSLQIIGGKAKRDPATIQPRITAEAQAGHVRITGSKDYADLYNLYMRIVGTMAWVLIGVRRKKFPFDDETSLKTPGVFEIREYQAYGVIDDEQVGLPSNIVSVTYAG